MFKEGNVVNFHSVIGLEITSRNHKIISISRKPNNFGCDVAWITEKSGCVALSALSNKDNPMRPREKSLTKSQKRYRAYLNSETTETFIEWLQNPFWNNYRARI